MLEKVNISPIIRDHLASFRDFRTGSRKGSDVILFWGIPICVAALCLWRGLLLSTASVNAILTAFSIFAGLLFNLLVMVLTFLQTSNSKGVDLGDLVTKKQILREVTANLSFAILLAMAIVGASVIVLSIAGKDQYYINRWGSMVLVLGVLNFALTLVMLLKRMYKLMQFEFDQHKFTNSGSKAA